MFSQIYKKINNPSCLLAISVFCFFALYHNSINNLVQSWMLDWNSHGVLLFIVCVYIFYQTWKRHSNKLDFSFAVSGYIILLGLSVLWLFANLTFIEYVELVSLPIILATLFISLLGWTQSRVFWFPILLMLLSGPLLSIFVPVLQDITAIASGLALELSGISTLVDGVLILVPAGTFEVDTSCSGLNVVTVGTILSLLYAYINHFRLKEGTVLLMFGMLVSILSNIIRVYIIVIVGNATKMQHALVEDHGYLGWIVFSIVFGIFIFVVSRYWTSKVNYENNSAHDLLVNKSPDNNTPERNYLSGAILSILIISVGPLLLLFSTMNTNKSYATEKFTSKSNGKWKTFESDNVVWQPVYMSGEGDYKYSQTFINNEQDIVYLDLRYFSRQNVGNEAVNVSNRVYDRNAWTRVWVKLYSSNIEGLAEVEETLIRGKNNQEMLVWRWYHTNGWNTGSPYKAKVYTLFGVLRGKPEITSYIIATTVKDTYSVGRKRLDEFVRLTIKQVNK